MLRSCNLVLSIRSALIWQLGSTRFSIHIGIYNYAVASHEQRAFYQALRYMDRITVAGIDCHCQWGQHNTDKQSAATSSIHLLLSSIIKSPSFT